MSHVCQHAERMGSATIGDAVRFSMFGEIEAFYNMLLAYREFLPLSPQLCQDRGLNIKDAKDKLSSFYIDMEKSLENGSFAQVVVNSYMKNIYKKYESELLNLNSPTHEYYSPDTKTHFRMHSLDAKFKKLIQRLPISIYEP